MSQLPYDLKQQNIIVAYLYLKLDCCLKIMLHKMNYFLKMFTMSMVSIHIIACSIDNRFVIKDNNWI
jgi:hypothetical protein